MLINIIIIFIGCINISLFIFIQHKSNTLLSFIEKYNTQNSINNTQNNQNDIYSLKNEIEKLKNENQNLRNQNQKLKNDNQNLKNENEKLKSKIDELNLELANKNNEFNNLKNEMKNLKLDNKKIEYIRKDDILTIHFKSIDQKVDMPFTCQKNDIFVRIEEILYNEYPEFKDLNTYFTVNGNIIKRFRSMQENSIKNNDKILLNIYE